MGPPGAIAYKHSSFTKLNFEGTFCIHRSEVFHSGYKNSEIQVHSRFLVLGIPQHVVAFQFRDFCKGKRLGCIYMQNLILHQKFSLATKIL